MYIGHQLDVGVWSDITRYGKDFVLTEAQKLKCTCDGLAIQLYSK